MRTVEAVLWMGGARHCDSRRVSCTLWGFSGKSFTECAVSHLYYAPRVVQPSSQSVLEQSYHL